MRSVASTCARCADSFTRSGVPLRGQKLHAATCLMTKSRPESRRPIVETTKAGVSWGSCGILDVNVEADRELAVLVYETAARTGSQLSGGEQSTDENELAINRSISKFVGSSGHVKTAKIDEF